MKFKQNLHTHTTYCDGKHTPEEIVVEAIKKGFDSIGFSRHSCSPVDSALSGYISSPEQTQQYMTEVHWLKEKYKNIISIFCGLEFDMYSKQDLSGYEFLIGAVHYLDCRGEIVGFDRTENVVHSVIDEYFNGDGMKYVQAYYETLARLPEYGNFDIVAHFDLITKHKDNAEFFDEDSKKYRNAAIESAEALSGKIPFFEVNTGAIARGYRKNPYPSMFLIKELKRLGFGAIISSDCHDKNMLDCSFNEAEELLKTAGFKEQYILTEHGFKAVSL